MISNYIVFIIGLNVTNNVDKVFVESTGCFLWITYTSVFINNTGMSFG